MAERVEVHVPLSLRQARTPFPGTKDQVYLDVSLNGLMPLPAREAAMNIPVVTRRAPRM